MTTVTAGSILYTDVSTYVNEPPIEYSGTIGAGDIVGSTIYLGASASSTAGSYIDCWLVCNPIDSNADHKVWKVTAYDATTKRATVTWDIAPLVGASWDLIIEYPLQRDFQWYRDGVAIPNAQHTMYTAQPSDIGKNLTVTETAWTISKTNDGETYETSGVTTTSTSAPVTVSGPAPSSKYVYQDNLSYLGSFALPQDLAVPPSTGGPETVFSATSASIIPASHSTNGQSTLVVNTFLGGGVGFLGRAEISIPTSLSSSNTFSALPVATVLKLSADVFGGQGNNALGLGPSEYRSFGTHHIHGSSKSLVTQANTYTPFQNGYFWRRDTDISSPAVEGPFTVIDAARGQLIARANAGWMTKVPAEWQAALGGDVIAGAGALSIVSSSSDGPCAICFKSSDIDATVAKVETGTAQGGTPKVGSQATITLSASAVGATTDYYKNFWIYVPSAGNVARRITAYNPTTKVATVDMDIGSWEIATPTSSSTYTLIPYLTGNQLAHYQTGDIEPGALPDTFSPMWHSGTWANGMVWPNGTDSLLYIGVHGGEFMQYGVPGFPGNAGSRKRIYQYAGPTGGNAPRTGFSPKGSGVRFWAYSAQDLQSVVTGALTYRTIKPKASWSMRLPDYGTHPIAYEASATMAYDQSTSRLYVITRMYGSNPSGSTRGVAVHVFHVTNAVSV